MTFWSFIALNLTAILWLVIGGALVGWAYYRGLNKQDPLPHIGVPKAATIASFFGRRARTPDANGQPAGDDPQPDPLPQSMRRA